MPKKPTTPFGFIAFGKDGSVRSNIEVLSSDKTEQEHSVARAFLSYGKHLLPEEADIGFLEEKDHDFCILKRGKKIVEIQCTEIVFSDFLTSEPSNEHVLVGNQLKSIDVERRDNVLVEKIKNKLAKHYAKSSEAELWLLVWSVTGYPDFYEATSSGKKVKPASVQNARIFLKENGAGPFDKIITFAMVFRPTVVWP